MFEHKYEIDLQNTKTVFLFGEDYYGDKPNFWKYHQTQLTDLYQSVLETGFPIQITDMKNNNILMVHSKKEFQEWLEANQPFKAED